MIWKFDARGFDFQSVQLSGIQPELYSVYQAAKAISTGSHNITLTALAVASIAGIVLNLIFPEKDFDPEKAFNADTVSKQIELEKK